MSQQSRNTQLITTHLYVQVLFGVGWTVWDNVLLSKLFTFCDTIALMHMFDE